MMREDLRQVKSSAPQSNLVDEDPQRCTPAAGDGGPERKGKGSTFNSPFSVIAVGNPAKRGR